jgi:DNA-binding GntR family transcriptional regulator
LSQRYGLLLGSSEERISIVGASPEIADALYLCSGAPVALLDRIVRTIDERSVEHRRAWCDLTDRYYLAATR